MRVKYTIPPEPRGQGGVVGIENNKRYARRFRSPPRWLGRKETGHYPNMPKTWANPNA